MDRRETRLLGTMNDYELARRLSKVRNQPVSFRFVSING